MSMALNLITYVASCVTELYQRKSFVLCPHLPLLIDVILLLFHGHPVTEFFVDSHSNAI